MRRIVFNGFQYEVIQTKLPATDTGEPIDVRLLRIIEGDTLYEFPLVPADWDNIVEQGTMKDDAMRDFKIVQPGDLPPSLRKPPPRPR